MVGALVNKTDTPINILLVADDADDCWVVKQIPAKSVHSFEYSLETAENISAAVEILKHKEFDIILLDLNLSDSNGIETVIKVHGVSPKIPIVVFTGLDDEETAIQAIKKGAEDYLIKGEALCNVLVRTIRYTIERKRAKVELEAMHRKLLETSRRELEQMVQEQTKALEIAREQLQQGFARIMNQTGIFRLLVV